MNELTSNWVIPEAQGFLLHHLFPDKKLILGPLVRVRACYTVSANLNFLVHSDGLGMSV